MNSANRACQYLLPKTGPLTAAQQRKLVAQALRFVACMRAHGRPAFPDPVVNANGIEMHPPTGAPPNSPVFRAAQQACQRLLPGGPPQRARTVSPHNGAAARDVRIHAAP